MVTQFVLDQGTYAFYRGRDGVVNCHKCGEIIKPFDKVVSKSVGSSRGEYRVLYHRVCAKEANLV